MKYADFKELMIKNKIAGPYLFMGEEGLVIDKTIDYIVSKFVDKTFKDLNYTFLNGDKLEMESFYSSVETLPFMSEKRVVVIDQLKKFLQNNDLSDTFFETLNNIADDTIVIFHDSDSDLAKNTKLYKFFKKEKRVVEFGRLNNRELSNFLKREISKKDKFITDGNLSYLIMLTGYTDWKSEINLYELESELEKLLAYSTGKEITRDDINKNIKKNTNSDIFDLLDSLALKDSNKSLNYLYELYEKDEPLNLIFHMIQRRYRHLYEYASLREDKVPEFEIKKVIGVSDYEFRVVSKAARNMRSCDLQQDISKILNIDLKSKTISQMNLLLMEYLIVNLCI